MITPTVGRVVWYWSDIGMNQPHAALIAHVWSDTCVNLAVFDANGRAYNKTSVLLVQEGNPKPDYNYCEWMPYQKGQAAKVDALESKLAHRTLANH